MVENSAVVDTTFVDIYVDTKNIPTCRYNIQHIDKRKMENKMSIIMWEAAMSYAFLCILDYSFKLTLTHQGPYNSKMNRY